MPTPRIMIVEDESLVAEDLKTQIERSGYDVVGVADTFEQAQKIAVEQRPDLAFLDIRIKGDRDGIQLAEALQDEHIGHIYLTSHSDEGTLARAEKTAPLGYVLKPFGSREILPVLRTAIYRHASENRLRNVESWLRTVLLSIGDAVVVTDAEARITYVNRAAERLIGCAMRDLLGEPFDRSFRIHEALSNRYLKCMASRCMSAGATVHLEGPCDLQRPDGRRTPVSDSAAPIRAADGAIIGAVLVLRDDTRQRELAHREREITARMTEALRREELSTMTSGLAHDLNNVLTSILGSASLARLSCPSDLDESLEQIEQSARHAARLCSRLRDDQATSPLVIERVSVDDAIDECLALVCTQRSADVTMRRGYDRSGLAVHADPVQLRRVLINLLLNAVEAAAPTAGTVVADVGELRATNPHADARKVLDVLPPGDYVWIEIKDDGSGIPDDVRARILEPFFTTKAHGSGLGLSNANAIVRRHGGSLTVESQVGVGTVVRVVLPMHHASHSDSGG